MTAQLAPIEAAEAKRMLDEGRALLIDIREKDEHAREHIPGARLAPLSALGAQTLALAPNKIAIFHCRSGMRTQANAERLLAHGPGPSFYLHGGLDAWKAIGLPTNCNASAPLEIMRQVQIAAGSLTLLGVALGASVNPAFYGLSAFIGAGLLFAGSTGWCGMALLLKAMPWNKTRRSA